MPSIAKLHKKKSPAKKSPKKSPKKLSPKKLSPKKLSPKKSAKKSPRKHVGAGLFEGIAKAAGMKTAPNTRASGSVAPGLGNAFSGKK